MTAILQTWYITSATWFYNSYLHASRTIEGSLAIKDTIRNLGRPLFQDYTFQGRVIGFLFRLIRIFLGGLSLCLAAIAYGIIYLVWLAFPLLCLVSLVGAFLGYSTPLQGGL